MRKGVIALAVVSLYVSVSLFGSLPDHLILFPTTVPLDAHGAVRKLLPFQNGELEMWMARSRLARQHDRAEIYVLRFYGNADRADRWVAAEAEAWNERAVEVWGMNYPGFGRRCPRQHSTHRLGKADAGEPAQVDKLRLG